MIKTTHTYGRWRASPIRVYAMMHYLAKRKADKQGFPYTEVGDLVGW